jgi:hypothetical protein
VFFIKNFQLIFVVCLWEKLLRPDDLFVPVLAKGKKIISPQSRRHAGQTRGDI